MERRRLAASLMLALLVAGCVTGDDPAPLAGSISLEVLITSSLEKQDGRGWLIGLARNPHPVEVGAMQAWISLGESPGQVVPGIVPRWVSLPGDVVPFYVELPTGGRLREPMDAHVDGIPRFGPVKDVKNWSVTTEVVEDLHGRTVKGEVRNLGSPASGIEVVSVLMDSAGRPVDLHRLTAVPSHLDHDEAGAFSVRMEDSLPWEVSVLSWAQGKRQE